jgi:hypothetical protein
MSDHFDITLERKLESNVDELDGGLSQVRRIERITGTGRRQRWSSDDKARILLDSFEPGARGRRTDLLGKISARYQMDT